MRCEELIHQRFIEPLMNKTTGNIGVELEFPLLNLGKKPIEADVALGLLNVFINKGFKVEEPDTNGSPAFITNEDGDCISFDNSYNNIEFSMNYGNNLVEIKKRFYSYIDTATSFLRKHNYIITGMGTNPYKKYITQSHVSYPVYNMVDRYLHTYSGEDTHVYPDFPSYLSSVQTHLDVSPKDLPKTATLFAKTDFLRGLLFSNSPDFDFGKTLCYRDELWHKSAFGLCNKNTGPVDEVYDTIDDIAKSYCDRCMFNNIRNGEYQIFYPQKVSDYFESNPAEDIEQFLSFRHIEITYRGTLEIRSDCSQPIYEAFLPPAFNLGLAHNIDEAIETTDSLFKNRRLSNSYLRNCVSTGTGIKEFSKAELTDYALKMVKIAKEGLVSRNKGEEAIIDPLFKRAETLTCPSMYILKNKDRLDEIITEYSKIEKA